MKQFIIKNKINLLFIFLFFYFYYYPIISLGLKYRDDYIRALFLSLSWVDEGRFISKWILNLFTFSNGVFIAPLPQILSIICIAFTIIYTAQAIFKKVNFFSYSIISLIFLNPFYLQNISFGYDSLPMTISTCCAVISAVIIQTKYYIPLTAFLAFIIIFSYQATVGIYINCILFILFIHYLNHGWSNQNKIYTKAIISISIFILICLIYMQVYPLLFSGSSTRVIMSLANIKSNILQTVYYIKLLFFNINYLFYIIILTVLISFFVFQFKQIKNKQLKPINFICNLIIIILLYIIFLLTAEGPSLLFKTHISDIRLLIAISFLWLFSFYIVSLFSKSLYYVFYFTFCAFCFSFSYSYGNFLKDQNQFFDMTMTNLNYDISHSHYTQSTKIFVLNPFPLSESNKKLTTKIPLFLHLYGEQSFDWLIMFKMSNVLPYSFSGDIQKLCRLTTDMNSEKKLNIESIKSSNYSLYFYQGDIFIDFYTGKNGYCKK